MKEPEPQITAWMNLTEYWAKDARHKSKLYNTLFFKKHKLLFFKKQKVCWEMQVFRW